MVEEKTSDVSRIVFLVKNISGPWQKGLVYFILNEISEEATFARFLHYYHKPYYK